MKLPPNFDVSQKYHFFFTSLLHKVLNIRLYIVSVVKKRQLSYLNFKFPKTSYLIFQEKYKKKSRNLQIVFRHK